MLTHVLFFILGLVALIAPLVVHSQLIRHEVPVTIVTLVAMVIRNQTRQGDSSG